MWPGDSTTHPAPARTSTQPLVDEDAPPSHSGRTWRTRRCFGCFASADIRALWVTFFLNTSFACAQVVGAEVSHSLALAGDTGTMLVDSVTYLINIVAAHVAILGFRESTAKAIELCAALVSVASLIVVAALTTQDSVLRIMHHNSTATPSVVVVSDEEPKIQPQVMFTFTALNMLIDIGMIGSIVLRKHGGWHGVITRCYRFAHTLGRRPEGPLAAGDGGGGGGDANDSAVALGTEGELNIFSALAHVLADTLRTVTEMACSLLVWCAEDSTLAPFP